MSFKVPEGTVPTKLELFDGTYNGSVVAQWSLRGLSLKPSAPTVSPVASN